MMSNYSPTLDNQTNSARFYAKEIPKMLASQKTKSTFNIEQRYVLYKSFYKCRFLTSKKVEKLAKKVKASPQQVRSWFTYQRKIQPATWNYEELKNEVGETVEFESFDDGDNDDVMADEDDFLATAIPQLLASKNLSLSAFDYEKRLILFKTFYHNKHPSKEELAELTSKTGLDSRQITDFFKYQRKQHPEDWEEWDLENVKAEMRSLEQRNTSGSEDNEVVDVNRSYMQVQEIATPRISFYLPTGNEEQWRHAEPAPAEYSIPMHW